LNISGNAKDISYNIGIGYQNEKGNFIREMFDRYNLKVSVTHTPSKFFQTGATANMSFNTFDQGSQNGYATAFTHVPVVPAFDKDGNIIQQPGTVAAVNGSGSNNFTSTDNPLIEIPSGSQETRRYDIMGNLFIQVTPIEGLDIKSTISPRFNRNRRGRYFGLTSQRIKDYANQNNMENFSWTWDNQITYNKIFGNHRLNATFINSFFHTRLESVSLAAEGFPYNGAWYNIYSGTLVPEECSTSYSETAMLSFAGRINYDYKGKYMLTATIRSDGSSKLADKWNTFPSAAVAWRISEEEFMKSAGWLSNLKARLSLGYSGNNNGVRPYGTINKPQTGSNVYYDFYGVTSSGFEPGRPVNPNLTWEKTRELNFGLDFGLFKNRINGSIELYDKLSDGLLMARRLAMESGVSSMTDNIGSVNNRGIELALNTVNIRTKDLYWSTSFTFAHNKNAIRTLYGRKEDVIGETHFIGQPINVIYDYHIIGVWTQAEYASGASKYFDKNGVQQYRALPGEAKTEDVSGDGLLGADDKIILGSPDPKWTGGFTSTLQYKNWDFSFNIVTRQGSFVYDWFFNRHGYSGGRANYKVWYDYYIPVDVPMPDWSVRNTDANGKVLMTWKSSGAGHENSKYPLVTNPLSGHTNFYGNNGNYQDASFVKVRTITLGYTFNKIPKVGINRLRVYVNVLNPFVFTKYPGWDPEFAQSRISQGRTESYAEGNGPATITYQMGVNVKF
jgi:TonB-linked SusC/RagA family outer membrane protein